MLNPMKIFQDVCHDIFHFGLDREFKNHIVFRVFKKRSPKEENSAMLGNHA